MAKALPPKAPLDVLDFPVDFVNLLLAGENITTIVSLTVDAGLTDDTGGNPAITTPNIVTLEFSGGTEGETYRIELVVRTDGGTPFREYHRTFSLTIKDL